MNPAIIVHGGAKKLSPEKFDVSRAGCLEAAEAGWKVLQEGGSALDAAEAAVRALEANPVYNAGRGAMLFPDGKVRLDAGLMDGRTLMAGAVGSVEGVPHPISIARRLLGDAPVLLVGPHAHRYAEEQGLELCDPEALITEEQRRNWQERQEKQQGGSEESSHDTVGCVALDAEGHVAAAASTGGTGDKRPGRVGDSALVGCGFYADDAVGGCAMTGDGEEIMRLALAHRTIDLLARGEFPNEAAFRALEELERRVQGEAGCILLDRMGRIGWAHNSSHMPVGYRIARMPRAVAFIAKQEEEEHGGASTQAA